MIDHENNSSAFPCVKTEEEEVIEYGMSMRDYFATKAMAAIISNCADYDYVEYKVAESAYKMADAMLKERFI